MIHIRIAFLTAALSVAAFGRADIAFNSLGTDDAFKPNNGYTIASSTSGVGRQSGAMQFQSLTSGDLLSITVPVWYLGGSGALSIGFYADSGNDVGAELASWSITASGQTTYTLDAPAGIALVQNSKYWVGLIAQDDSYLAWNYAVTPVQGRYAVNYDLQNGTVSGEQSAFRVDTQAVPEPASMAALGLGAAAFFRRRRR